jgi:hypothetical protein
MDSRERAALDRHITGNYGEDQFKGEEFDDAALNRLFRQSYNAARKALLGGAHVVIATVPVSEQRIRVIQLRKKAGQYEGKYIADGKWYLICKVEVE